MFIVILVTVPRLLYRYIFKEIAVPFLLSLSVLTVTAILSKVIKLIELMVTHGVGPSFILWFVASVVPSFLIYTIPISFLIAVLVALTRLSSDSEITAMKASGLSLFTVMRPVMAMAAIACGAALFVTLYLFPWGNGNLKQLLLDAARTKLVAGIEEKTFYDRFEGVILFVDRLNTKTGEMEGIFISEVDGGKESNVFFAKRGLFSPSEGEFSVYLKLDEGTIHRKSDTNSAYHIADFATYTLELSLTGKEPMKPTDKPNREMYVGELARKVGEVRAAKEDAAPYIIDLHKRFALPASVFVFALLALPLGIQSVRTAKFTGFSVALGVVLVYYVVSTAFEALGENSTINPVLSVWASDIIFTVFGGYVFYRAARDNPVDVFSWASNAAEFFWRNKKA